jgi:uncharacterized protein
VQRIILLIFLLVAASGCATYQAETAGARNYFYAGDYQKAADQLTKKAQEDSKDQVLYLFDRGMALQLAGDYKGSEKDWLLADKLTDVKDYTSLSTQALTLLTNDRITQYSGEDFEKVMINALLAIDYTLQSNFEDALVECRRVNEKLYKYKFEAKRDYEQNPFARYLSALIWEASGKLEDAYIDYKEAYKISPSYPYLKYDLVRLAKWLHRDEDLKEWTKQYGEVEVQSRKNYLQQGELVLIYQQGHIAEKRPALENPRFPKFYYRGSRTQQARIELADVQNKQELAQKIYSASEIAIKTLNDAFAGLVAKRAAGIAAKAVVANQISQKNKLLGALTWVGLNAADQADTRQWETLPESLQFARLLVSPGEHTIRVVGLDSQGQPTGEANVFEHVKVEPGKKVFLSWRSLK